MDWIERIDNCPVFLGRWLHVCKDVKSDHIKLASSRVENGTRGCRSETHHGKYECVHLRCDMSLLCLSFYTCYIIVVSRNTVMVSICLIKRV